MPSRTRLHISMFCLGLGIAVTAHAQATRTWVSGVGDDANPCSRTAPCKTFAGAISKTAASGEINVLDPGGFGAVTITKSITISSEGFEGGVLVSGTNGIVVNAAATDKVVLRGLDIEGLGTGLNGIRFLAGASLTVENCIINNFTQRGISFEPSAASQLFVRDSVIRNNLNAANGGGILVQPSGAGTATGEIDNVRLERNTFGLRVNNAARLMVRDTTVTHSTSHGFWAFTTGTASSLFLDHCASDFNVGSGLRVEGASAAIRTTGSSMTGNGIGMQVITGQLISFGNNRNDGNSSNGAPNVPVAEQ